MLWHSACWGCAGISRQLHPLKVKDPMKDRVIKIKEENDVRINIIMFTSIWSSWAREFNHSIIVQVSTPRVCYNQSSTAYLEGRRWEIGVGWGKNVKVIEIDQKIIRGRGLNISIKSAWAHDINRPIVVLVSTSRVRWNWSSTASLEDERTNEGQSKKKNKQKNIMQR